jgi:hypothetical protein
LTHGYTLAYQDSRCHEPRTKGYYLTIVGSTETS